MTIKAIETSYKGYRFRSRLEARWAVVFEAQGLKWEYEPEGFELGEIGRYLPDFYLPALNTWVEIKPDGEPTKAEHIYMAGKVGVNCWRHDIVGGLRGAWNYRDKPWVWPQIYISGRSGLTYTGPYFVSDDHGMGHSPQRHGAAYSPMSCGPTLHENDVLALCLDAIHAATTVFVWINSADCYATLIEVGYALGRNKRIVVGMSQEIWRDLMGEPTYDGAWDNHTEELTKTARHDMWFLKAVADNFGVFDTARAAFDKLVRPENIELQKLKKAANGANYALLYGTPGDHKIVSNGGLWLTPKAIAAGRSARFEHGEMPA